MRRLLLVFVVMAAMVAVMAAPAFAEQNNGCRGVTNSLETRGGGAANSGHANENAPFAIFECA
jgi:hypothetical protein